MGGGDRSRAGEFRAPVGARFAVFRSRDRGGRWERLDRGLPNRDAYLNVYRQALAADSLDDPGVYVGTGAGQIFGSLDGGDSWELVADNLPPIYSLETAVL